MQSVTQMTKRQVLLRYGFNFRAFDTLVEEGVLTVDIKPGVRSTILVDTESLSSLEEGPHYVVCHECQSFAGQITTKHLKACSGITLDTYRGRHPKAALMSDLVARRKQKTLEQREHQSRTLKRRFQTKAGEVTRRQISEASRRCLQDPKYRAKASKHLKTLTSSSEQRAQTSARFKEMWKDPVFRKKLAKWRSDNSEFVAHSAAHAREHLTPKFTKPHRTFKRLLENAGLEFQTEYQVGFYAIDEASPDLKVAVEIDGCYWHGCPHCKSLPFGDNARLDKRKTTYLERRGWAVLRVRECDLKKDPSACLQKVRTVVESRTHGC